jgi:hypothetical protein
VAAGIYGCAWEWDAQSPTEICYGNRIPLWMFGMLYYSDLWLGKPLNCFQNTAEYQKICYKNHAIF